MTSTPTHCPLNGSNATAVKRSWVYGEWGGAPHRITHLASKHCERLEWRDSLEMQILESVSVAHGG